MNIVRLSERIARIEAEISGVKAQSDITQWEINFLNNLKRLRFGSDAQRVILERIEKKVFGETV